MVGDIDDPLRRLRFDVLLERRSDAAAQDNERDDEGCEKRRIAAERAVLTDRVVWDRPDQVVGRDDSGGAE